MRVEPALPFQAQRIDAYDGDEWERRFGHLHFSAAWTKTNSIVIEHAYVLHCTILFCFALLIGWSDEFARRVMVIPCPEQSPQIDV